MDDPRIQRLARTLVGYSVGVRPGDKVLLTCQGSIVAAVPMLTELFREVVRAGGHPHVILGQTGTEEWGCFFFAHATDKQLTYVDPIADLVARTFDCDITICSSQNTRSLAGVDGARQSARRRAYKDVMGTYLARAAKGQLRWVLAGIPTTAYAQEAQMSLSDYENFLFSAVFADSEDPIARWKRMEERNGKIVDSIKGARSIRVKSPHADLSFSVEGRIFISDHGHFNMPDGEIFTGPVEVSLEGSFRSTFPTVFADTEFGEVSLEFEHGMVVSAKAESNQDKLTKLLDTDEGSRRVGEFGIGTNEGVNRFTGTMLFDEKMEGTVHFALGSGFPESGSTNDSAIHWDLLCDMRDHGEIIVDGTVRYDSGRFLLLP